MSYFFSRGHTPGLCTKTKRRSPGCQSRYLPKPSAVGTGDTPSPLRHPSPGPRGTPSPSGVRGGLKGDGRTGAACRRGGMTPGPPLPALRPGTFPPHGSLFPARRRPGLPLRRREAAGAGGRDPPRAERSLPGEEPAGSHRARSPSPAPSSQTQPPGLGVGGEDRPAGRLSCREREDGRNFPPRRRRRR